MDDSDGSFEKYLQGLLEASAELNHFTFPIAFAKDGKLLFDRTGVLLRIGDLSFVLTAGHDLNTYFEMKLIPFAITSAAPIRLDFKKLLLWTQEAADVVDVAAYLIDDGPAKELEEHYRFLNIQNLMARTHRNHEGALYILLGFPEELMVKSAEREVVNPVRYLAGHYGRSGDLSIIKKYDPKVHLPIEYEKLGHTGEKTARLNGASGGGIWFACNFETRARGTKPEFKLAAIQNRSTYGEYAMGTWVELALQLIWEQIPDARAPMRVHGIDFH